MKTIDIPIKIKWEILGYGISENNTLYNLKTRKELKEIRKGYTIGYYIKGKFKSLKWIRANCKLYKDKYCPF